MYLGSFGPIFEVSGDSLWKSVFLWFLHLKGVDFAPNIFMRILNCYINIIKVSKTKGFRHFWWSLRRDSNSWPQPYQGCALPAAPRKHMWFWGDFCLFFMRFRHPQKLVNLFYQGDALPTEPYQHKAVLNYCVGLCNLG